MSLGLRKMWAILEELTHPIGRTSGLPIPYRFERNVVTSLRRIHGDLFVDVGANAGYYCTLLARNFQRLVAIEPAPQNLHLMKALFRANMVKVEILPYAVTNQDGTTSLFFAKDMSGHQVKLPTHQESALGTIRVPSVTIRTLVKRYGTIDLIKVDVESAEWLVLEGAEGSTSLVRKWVIELHGRGSSVPGAVARSELEEWMKAHDYAFRWLDSKHIYAWH